MKFLMNSSTDWWMVSNVDLSVVVHFRYSISSNAVKFLKLKDLNTWTLIALLEEAVQ